MLTDLVQIKRLGEKQREENQRFRAWMRRHNFVERRFKAIAQEVEAAVDCTACANCCRVATTQLTDRDVERISHKLGMKKQEFLLDYTEKSKKEGLTLKRTGQGCFFL